MDTLPGPSPRASDLARASFDEGDGDASNSMQHSSILDVTDATIGQVTTDGSKGRKDAPCIVLPHQSDYVSHIALDIGGSLIKLVYFSMDDDDDSSAGGSGGGNGGATDHGTGPARRSHGGKLHFVKFETAKLGQCMDFIEAKGLHRSNGGGSKMRVKATGGGAYKYAEAFRERLGLILEREDEMACMVDGCNFLLKAVRHEAFMYENSQLSFVDIHTEELYPYLLVNIGSGVSMVRVEGEGKFQRVSGTNIGGGTFWGLCRLLTGRSNFDEILELSSTGDNSNVDMLVGDIYGGRDYTGIGLSANTIASSFGKVLHENKRLENYNPADVALSLCRMISYNIGQLAYLNAKRYNLSRIFFGGFFIRGHPYTMETISFAIRFWSKGEMAAHFLRHEGFLGSVGAFMKVQAMRPLYSAAEKDAGKVRARFVERFKMGAPIMGGEVHGPAMHSMHDKLDWVEKFIVAGRSVSRAAREEHERALKHPVDFKRHPSGQGELSDVVAVAAQYSQHARHAAATGGRLKLNVGVLHFSPYSEPFALLADTVHYDPNTIDINIDRGELEYWAGVLQDQIPTVVEKAVTSEGSTKEAQRRASAFGRALDLHLTKLRLEPGAYGQLGLADLFELREECLREFGFADVYRHDKARENSAALEVLPDLLGELDGLPPRERLLALLQGVLAANIFDWGAKACVDMYHNATILEMYREARTKLSARPWRVDHFDQFADIWFSQSSLGEGGWGSVPSPYKRVVMFVDNAGADVVLGMLPLARELLKMGAEVVLVANSLPAINDITAAELRSVVARAADLDHTIRAARDAAISAQAANNGRVPPFPGMKQRVVSPLVLSSANSRSPEKKALDELPAARSAGGFAYGPAPVRKPGHNFHLLTAASGGSGSGTDEDYPRRYTAPHRLQTARSAPDPLQSATPSEASASPLERSPSGSEHSETGVQQQAATPDRDRQQQQLGAEGSGPSAAAASGPSEPPFLEAGGGASAEERPVSRPDSRLQEALHMLEGATLSEGEGEDEGEGITSPFSAASLQATSSDGEEEEEAAFCSGSAAAGLPGGALAASNAGRQSVGSAHCGDGSSQAGGGGEGGGAEVCCIRLAPAGGAAPPSGSSSSNSVISLGDRGARSSPLKGQSMKGMFGESYPSPWRDPRLYIVASGHGSPCLDLRRVSADVADATVGADLVVIEGMGRAIHTNYNAKFKCDALKLAMIKNRHLAQRLFGGDVYDCVCRYDGTTEF